MIQKLFGIAYNLTGPYLATKLAVNKITLFFAGLYRSDVIFRGKYDIKMCLTPKEALILGFPFLKVINPYETVIFEDLIKKYNITTFVSVGCGEGWYLYLAKKLNDSIQIYGFEPISRFVERIKANLKLNSINSEKVKIESMAISDTEGEAEFWDSGYTSSLIKENSELFEKAKKIKIKTTTLDSYFENKPLSKNILLQIDTEGAEHRVLNGGSEFIKKHRPAVIMLEIIEEVLTNAGTSPKTVIAVLENLNYEAYVYNKDKLKLYNEGAKSSTMNMVFLTKKTAPIKEPSSID